MTDIQKERVTLIDRDRGRDNERQIQKDNETGRNAETEELLF